VVERKLPKLDAAGSIPVSRSTSLFDSHPGLNSVMLKSLCGKPGVLPNSQRFPRFFFPWAGAILACIVLIGAGCSQAVKPTSPEDTPKIHYQNGLKLLDDKDPLKPENEFRRAIELDSRSPYGYTGLAAMYLNRKYPNRALKNANRALSRDPSFADAAFLQGKCYLQGKWKDRFVKAEASFRRLLVIEPESERALYFLGETFLASYRFEEASGYYSQAAEKKGTYANDAAARIDLVDRTMEAKPATDDSRRICIERDASRDDVCHLLIGELNLKDLVKRLRLMRYEAIYHGNEGIKKLPQDIEERDDRKIILDIMALRFPHLDVFPNGDFYPDRKVTRAECAMIMQEIVEFLSDDPTLATRYASSDSPFSDVRPDYYAFNAIMLCGERGIIKTDPSMGKFDPDGSVRGVDVLLMIRALGSLYAGN
jgi:Tfp pilus assembly protein PilF